MIDKIQILNFLGLDLDLENQIDFKKDINFFRNVVVIYLIRSGIAFY